MVVVAAEALTWDVLLFRGGMFGLFEKEVVVPSCYCDFKRQEEKTESFVQGCKVKEKQCERTIFR